jgi:hypothetical protein
MRARPKLVPALLFLSALLLTACNQKTDPVEANLAALEQSCTQLAELEAYDVDSKILCACVTSKMRLNYSEEEQRVVAAVMADGVKRFKAGNKHPTEKELIMLHSDLTAEQSKIFARRISGEIIGCEP